MLVNIASVNDLPVRCHAIGQANADSLSTEPWGTYFCKVLYKKTSKCVQNINQLAHVWITY